MNKVDEVTKNQGFMYLYLFLMFAWIAGLFMALDIYLFMLSLGDKAELNVVYWWFFLVILSVVSILLSAYAAYRYFTALKKAQKALAENNNEQSV
ncbi:MAG: hypothetical protein J6N72_04920 [Psychrobacter sp.]|nr:hypothetical protein [Psychrobacter sp.]